MSNETVKGIVEAVSKSAKGYWSAKVGETWFGFGKYPPKFDQGDEVSFEFTTNGDFKNAEYKTVTVLGKGSGGGETASSGGGTKATAGTNWDLKDKRITYLASRKDAIEIARLCIDKDALTLPAKKADRMDIILEFVNEVSNDLYKDIYGEEFSSE